MPTLLEQTEVHLEWTDIAKRVRHPAPPTHVRAPGTHLSGILRAIAIESGILKVYAPQNVDSTQRGGSAADLDEDIMPLRMIMGMAVEEYFAGFYPDMQWQPGELERDGIFGNPDGITLNPLLNGGGSVMVDEFKATWKSEFTYGGKQFLSNWMWMRQGMGYCAMLGTRWVRFHIVWMNGDYRPPQPRYYRYLVEFTQKEIDNAWNLNLRNKHKAVKE